MKLRAGDEVTVNDVPHTVVAISGPTITLHNLHTGQSFETLTRELFRASAVSYSDPSAGSTARDLALLAHVAPAVRDEVDVWVSHLRQLQDDLDAGQIPASIAIANVMHSLALAGQPVSLRTLQRKRAAYRERGAYGLLDKRRSEKAVPRRIDARVITALLAEMQSNITASTGTMQRLIFLTRQRLDREYGRGTVPMPTDRSMRRLINEKTRGMSVTGSAKTRRSQANTPDRQFTPMAVSRPGEQVQIDSTKLDVLVRIGDDIARKPELTIMIDVVTRSIISAVMRLEGTKSSDLTVLLAKALVPFSARPDTNDDSGGVSAAYRREVPYIFPETITVDNGKIFVSEHFKTACESLGISLNFSAPYTPTDKSKVERTFGSINTLFAQYVKGYTGRSVEYRGVEEDPLTLHSLVEIQSLFEEWVAVLWQNRRHSALVDPLNPAQSMSPNEVFDAFSQLMPQAVVPFDADTYISLLPVHWLTIQAGGVRVGGRTYDSAALRELRGTKSKIAGRGGRWPVHVDPYDIQTVWLAVDNRWLTLQWANAEFTGPMSAEVYGIARKAERSVRRAATEADIAEHARGILERAGAGSGRKRDRIAAARSQAVADDPMRMSRQRKVAPAEAEPEPVIELPRPRARLKLLDYTEELENDRA